MTTKVVNKFGELKVTTTDVGLLERRLLDGVLAIEELLVEAKLIRHMLAEALELDIQPDEVEE